MSQKVRLSYNNNKFLYIVNTFLVPQPQAYQVMQPQMPPNPFLGAARGMMQPPLPQGPVHLEI